MRILTLVTDAYGGRGGIAKFNRDLLQALTAHARVEEVVALPRVMVDEPGELPRRLTFVTASAGSKVAYSRALLKLLAHDRDFDLVVCGHINLLPLAFMATRRCGAPLLLIGHGVEVWKPWGGRLRQRLDRYVASRLAAIVTVSNVTRERMAAWLPIDAVPSFVVPNTVDQDNFGPGPKPAFLQDRYGLEEATVLLTVARLSAGERYKGIDEVMEVLPGLAEHIPDVKYLVCGDGDDRQRLERKAYDLGLADRVVFAGYIPEEEKADHYRLADVFVMPGRGEGFGIVYLEALACGVPVVASSADASREAVLDGELGEVVDPHDPRDIRRGILAALSRPREVPDRLEHFSFDNFVRRWHSVLDHRTDRVPSFEASRDVAAAVAA